MKGIFVRHSDCFFMFFHNILYSSHAIPHSGTKLVKSWPDPAEPAAKRASHSAAQGACQVSGAGEDMRRLARENYRKFC